MTWGSDEVSAERPSTTPVLHTEVERAEAVRKAVRLQIAARLLATHHVASDEDSPSMGLRRTRALIQADKLMTENEEMP